MLCAKSTALCRHLTMLQRCLHRTHLRPFSSSPSHNKFTGRVCQHSTLSRSGICKSSKDLKNHQNSLDGEKHGTRVQQLSRKAKQDPQASVALASALLWLLAELPAGAEEAITTDFSKGSFSTQSYVVTLGLFLISLPGIFTLGLQLLIDSQSLLGTSTVSPFTAQKHKIRIRR